MFLFFRFGPLKRTFKPNLAILATQNGALKRKLIESTCIQTCSLSLTLVAKFFRKKPIKDATSVYRSNKYE